MHKPASHMPALVFSGMGHLYMHYACAMFFTVVLALEVEWNTPFYELNELWTIGAALVGLVALPAGRLGDKWSARGMMAIFFIGLGLSLVACGFAEKPSVLVIALAGVGLFSAIYHPWLIANSTENTGKALALNGAFGGLGPAAAALVTAFIVDVVGWRWAFWVPGAVVIATGVAILGYIKAGHIPSTDLGKSDATSPNRRDTVKVFIVLLFAMTMGGLVYHSMQSVLPKFFVLKLDGFVDGSIQRAGFLVGVIYTVSAFAQFIGGHMADRYSTKMVYLVGWLTQVVFLAAIVNFAGYGIFAATLVAAAVSAGILPAENMLLYKYSPASHKGLAFGVKFVLSFGVAPLSLHLISYVQELTGDFYWLFMGFSALSAIVFIVAFALPSDKHDDVIAPAE